MRKIAIVAWFSILAALASGAAAAVDDEELPAVDTRVTESGNTVKLYYNPHTGSYFEYHWFDPAQTGSTQGASWDQAQRLAQRSTYRGVPGRLAVVSDADTHDFLLRQFDIPEETWIGLKVVCSGRKSEWVNGNDLDQQAFVAWDIQQWYRTDVRCGKANIDWMGGYYLPRSKAFRWQAAGQAKRFRAMFVEYPVGQP